jgi:DNA-binding HxlR family transcriptional regulator
MKRTQPFECPVNAALGIIGGRWKILIIYNLFEGIARFNELQRATGGISKRVLTAQLRQLERDGIVTRKVYDSSPLRVEYALTEVGRSLEPVMELLCVWGEGYGERIAASSAQPMKSPESVT